MRTTQQLSVTLPNDMADVVKAKVRSGEYASESEVIRDGLCPLMAWDRATESWLHGQVSPAYDAVKAYPSRAVGPDQMRAQLAREGAASHRVVFSPEADEHLAAIYRCIGGTASADVVAHTPTGVGRGIRRREVLSGPVRDRRPGRAAAARPRDLLGSGPWAACADNGRCRVRGHEDWGEGGLIGERRWDC